MKKIIISVSLALFVTTTAFAGGSTNSLSDCLKTCDEYYSSQTVSLPSLSLTTKRQILGLDSNSLCKYKETVSSQNSVYTVNCKFTKDQRTALAKVMEEFDNNSDNDSIDMNDFSQVQNTKVYEVWSKYLQDPSVCEILTK